MKISKILIILISFFVMAGNAFAGRVEICHKGQTIKISESSVDAHLNHGDYDRACGEVPNAVALFRCGGVDIRILSVSLSEGVPLENGLLVSGSSCSASIALLTHNGFEPTHINTVYDATFLGVVTDYGYTGNSVRQDQVIQ